MHPYLLIYALVAAPALLLAVLAIRDGGDAS